MAAIVLQSIGYEVLILERSSALYTDGCEAGIHLGLYAQKFFQHYMPRGEAEYAKEHPTILEGMVFMSNVVVDAESGVIHSLAHRKDQVWTANWNVVYMALLRALQTPTGGTSIRIGAKVTNAHLTKDGRWNVISEGKEDEQADLLIGADGAYSTVRSLVLPSLEPQYDGYLAWQGRFSAKNIPTQFEKVLEGELLWVRMPKHYIIL
jgi:2-polyprenyl-6-methoxyphenol hydroxylase-like FAD-dependent oxidoreductase